MPIDISADHTKMEPNGVATAEGNVIIRYGEAVVYCDSMHFNNDTKDALLVGNVRIYRDGHLFTGARAVYNLDTKKITAADFNADVYPYQYFADTLTSLNSNTFEVHDGLFTTSDNSKPDYHMEAHRARIYEKDRIILYDVYFYVGRTPIFWFPYVYQSLNKNEGFTIVPGYNSTFGAYLRNRLTFPITQDIGATAQLDLLSNRGIGLGLSSKWGGGDTKETPEWGSFDSYYIHDSDPGQNKTALNRPTLDPNRYRVSLRDRTYLTEDIYSSININKLSDAFFLQDFLPAQYRSDRNPDNMIALTKWDEDYTVTLFGRKSLNSFFDVTEKLPELALDVKERPIFGDSGLFYVGETSGGYYRRDFASGSIFSDFASARVDSFHQIIFPKELFGWLSVVPKVGVRGTYYSNSGSFVDVPDPAGVKLQSGQTVTSVPTLLTSGDKFRAVVNAGFETSFKLSRAYEQVQSRTWGLDGLRHVIQPYMDFSYVWTNQNPVNLLQFDRINPSTERAPIDFPEFNSIDAIEKQAIVRLGVNNRFQTRRDNQTVEWLQFSSSFDIRIQRPEFEQTFLSLPLTNASTKTVTPVQGMNPDPGTFSNLYNHLAWTPFNWVRFSVDAQTPIFDKGYWAINTTANFMVNVDTSLQLSHEYLSGNSIFDPSSYFIFGGYRRITDNWGISMKDAYEFEHGHMAVQQYSIHRDLSSWLASLTFEVLNNGAGSQPIYGIELSFTLKDMPQVALPFSFNPEEAVGGSDSSKNPSSAQ